MIIGAAFVVLGDIFRLLIGYTGFYMVIVGQFIAAIGSPFLLNPIGKMATSWFGDKEVITGEFYLNRKESPQPLGAWLARSELLQASFFQTPSSKRIFQFLRQNQPSNST